MATDGDGVGVVILYDPHGTHAEGWTSGTWPARIAATVDLGVRTDTAWPLVRGRRPV
jgi:hypothetical protein